MQGLGLFKSLPVRWEEIGNVTIKLRPIKGVVYPDDVFRNFGSKLIRTRLIIKRADGSLGTISNPDFQITKEHNGN